MEDNTDQLVFASSPDSFQRHLQSAQQILRRQRRDSDLAPSRARLLIKADDALTLIASAIARTTYA